MEQPNQSQQNLGYDHHGYPVQFSPLAMHSEMRYPIVRALTMTKRLLLIVASILGGRLPTTDYSYRIFNSSQSKSACPTIKRAPRAPDVIGMQLPAKRKLELDGESVTHFLNLARNR